MKISSLFKPLSFLPALLLMYMIYSFSSQPGDVSSSVSFKVSEKIVDPAELGQLADQPEGRGDQPVCAKRRSYE